MQTKILYLGYHYNNVDGMHVNRIIKTIEEVKSFIDARASEMYSADVEDLVKSIPSMTVGQCKCLDIDNGDWVTVTCVETPSENNSELDFNSAWLPSVQIGKKDADSLEEAIGVYDDEDGWRISDPDCRQKFKKIDENRFLYREDRISNPETKEMYVYESMMDFDDYNEDDLEKGVKSYYKNLDEVKSIYGNDWKQIVLECIFEQEIGDL
jgi:hypothetical protein